VYGAPIDLFGVGVIMAEMYQRVALLPGTSEVINAQEQHVKWRLSVSFV
jgi:hypothetical protein